MRELSLIETCYLGGVLLLSLVLPLLLSLRAPSDAAIRKESMRVVWLGQTVGAICGVIILISGAFAPYAAIFAALSIFACAFVLKGKFRRLRRA